MLPVSTLKVAALALIAGLVAGGCGTANTDILSQPAAAVTNGIATLGKVEFPKVEIPAPDADPVGSPTELYNRIARGATRCWFGAEGNLKANYIFNATAEPEAKGAGSEIVIHEKDPRMPDPRGNRAFRVQIMPVGDTARVEIENIRFPAEDAQRMQAEVRRWARDDVTCTPRPEAAKAPEPAPPTPEPKAAKPEKAKPKPKGSAA